MDESNKLLLVSVIIPTYNHADYVDKAVLSVLDQTYKNIEIVVVDDGSNDDTKRILSRFKTKIKYVYQKNQGLSAARNTGIKRSKGDILAFLDADDVWYKNKLQKQLEMIVDDDFLDWVSCSGYYIDKENDVIGEFNNNDVCKSMSELFKHNTIVCGGSGVIVRRKCIDFVGLFNEQLKSAEDWDMWLRLSVHCKLGFVSGRLAGIRKLTNSMSSFQNSKTMLNNELKVINMYFEGKWNLSDIIKKRIAYSYRYYIAAWGCKEGGKRKDAFELILKSLINNPMVIFKKSHLIIMMYVLFNINIILNRST